MSMKQPPPKRRRVSSNLVTAVSPPEVLLASPKPSRVSTCIACHRTVGLRSSPAFVCMRFVVFSSETRSMSHHALYHRCSASTCAICLRACTGDLIPGSRWTGSLSPPPDSPPSPLSQSITNASSPCRRRRRDEDSDSIVVKTRDAGNGRSGCGQMVCRMCCFEHPQSGIVACLDCSAKQRARQTHDPDASIHETLNLDYDLTAST
ncbi:hypothetical protein BJV78DRAFT_1244625 [Lactifluus subvellereus]|nr:hypothetical protein BJV78DRAFT_1244625 [Lactifluus subvellereus]